MNILTRVDIEPVYVEIASSLLLNITNNFRKNGLIRFDVFWSVTKTVLNVSFVYCIFLKNMTGKDYALEVRGFIR